MINKIALAVLFFMLGFGYHKATNAGPFLDLDIGTLVGALDGRACDYINTEANGDGTFTSYCQPQNNYLGNDGLIGIIRVGYRTDAVKLFGPIDGSVHTYYEHMSATGDGSDSGVNVLMFGVRLE